MRSYRGVGNLSALIVRFQIYRIKKFILLHSRPSIERTFFVWTLSVVRIYTSEVLRYEYQTIASFGFDRSRSVLSLRFRYFFYWGFNS